MQGSAQEAQAARCRDAWTEHKAYLTEDTETNKRDKKAEKQGETMRERKGKRGESETVIRLQSLLLSDLFRILNRLSRSIKTKDETIIR